MPRLLRSAALAVALPGVLACGADGPPEIESASSAPPRTEDGTPGDTGDTEGAAPVAETEAPAPPPPTEARYFRVGADGRLHPVPFELPPSAVTRDEAEAVVRRVVADSGAFPRGVEVLDVFVSGRGVAVVNFTNTLLLGHSGGLLAEELTVYSLSHSLVENFAAIAEVRFLVEGQEAGTLAGHLDLRSGFGRAPARLLPEAEPG